MKLLAERKISSNKKKAINLYLALNPGAKSCTSGGKLTDVIEDGLKLRVSGSCDKRAIMVAEPTGVPLGALSPWMKKIDKYILVRQAPSHIVIYEVTDFKRLASYRGEGKYVAGSAVSWENVQRVSDSITTIV